MYLLNNMSRTNAINFRQPNVRRIMVILVFCFLSSVSMGQKRVYVDQWEPIEITFSSVVAYDNPVYDAVLESTFVSPSGEQHHVEGFWDGGNNWKIRFMPNEKGVWHYRTHCTDTANHTLHNQSGTFRCRKNKSRLEIYEHGKVTHEAGNYHITHADGTPFFYLGCTAWNGAMRSTDGEWATYLKHRRANNYSVIQFVTTQWRGLPPEALEEIAFTGVEPINVNPVFFQQLDKKVEQINAAGLVAAPIMLWAWSGKGNPGKDLPVPSAVKLAKYIKARYDAYHVIWNLGGDGVFTGDNEARWKQIGHEVFGDRRANQSMVTLHTAGFQWYGRAYDGASWLDMISYQTGHTNSANAVRWKTRGPVVSDWKDLTPRPIIDTEPAYEGQGERENDYEVRKSSLWSLFSAPVAGVGYGAWSTWPWLRVGETSYNHGMKEPSKYDWEDGINSKASIQIGRLPAFFNQFEWWRLKPARDVVTSQREGDQVLNTISVLTDEDAGVMLVYVPVAQTFELTYENAEQIKDAVWYYPATGTYESADVDRSNNIIEAMSKSDTDVILVLKK